MQLQHGLRFQRRRQVRAIGPVRGVAIAFASAFQRAGPVIVVALPGIPQRNPITGDITQAAFVLQAPAGNNSGVTNGSASVPFNTTLVFAAGSTLKLQNASLYVQNQGSALQAQGTTSNPVNFTSYNDASIGGATNNNPDTTPHAGDWGGIVFRNYDQAANALRSTFPVDGTLGRAQRRRRHLRRVRRDVDLEQLQYSLRRRRGPAGIEQFLQRASRSSTPGRRSPTAVSPTREAREEPRRPSPPTSTRSAKTTRPAVR